MNGKSRTSHPQNHTNERGAFRHFPSVLDDLHVAASNTPRVKAAVRTFVETVTSPNDSPALVFTSGVAGGGQDFRPDRRLVMRVRWCCS